MTALPKTALLVALISAPVSFALADSITVDGKTYEDVYVRQTLSGYDILIPGDGTEVCIPGDHVKKRDVHISKDADLRWDLLRTWLANRRARKARDAARSRSDDGATADDGSPAGPPALEPPAMQEREESAPPPVHITGGTKRGRRKRLSEFKAYSDKDGLTMLTNRPDKYREGAAPPAFRDRNGVLLLTTDPDKYRGKADFVEFTASFDIIEIPERFRVSAATAPAAGRNIAEYVSHYAKVYALDESLIYAVIRAESNFDEGAVSRAGARGLMQLMPGTAAEMGVTNIFDPAQNIAGGTQYLAKMLEMFDNDVRLALAAYNAGPANVLKHRGVPPFKETRDYVATVQRFAREYAQGTRHPTTTRRTGRLAFDYLPEAEEAAYVIEFSNGLTERATAIKKSGNYYYVDFEGSVHRVRASDVRRIVEPKA